MPTRSISCRVPYNSDFVFIKTPPSSPKSWYQVMVSSHGIKSWHRACRRVFILKGTQPFCRFFDPQRAGVHAQSLSAAEQAPAFTLLNCKLLNWPRSDFSLWRLPRCFAGVAAASLEYPSVHSRRTGTAAHQTVTDRVTA